MNLTIVNREIKPPDVGGNTPRQLPSNVTFYLIYLIFMRQSHVDGLFPLDSTIYDNHYIEMEGDKVHA